jgi:L-serine deaminase
VVVARPLQEALPNVTKDDIINAMATAGLVGNVIKTNASISGAEVRETIA